MSTQREKPLGTKSKKNSVSTFIKKLYSMVNDKVHQDLISWGLTGESFIIYNSKNFSKRVLPEHFKHGNFSSFVRQLNMYGFRKINKASRGKHGTDQNEVWEFMHPQFQRDRQDKLSEIKRKAANSEMLRRDTGNIHLSVRKIQADQQKLLDQFHVLQNNFSALWQGYEDLKRNQHDLQQGIHKLADVQDKVYASLIIVIIYTNSTAFINLFGGGLISLSFYSDHHLFFPYFNINYNSIINNTNNNRI
ncbi:HSF-type DNA-binding-domain-containing protein [Phascolomyces articulosus]|uniref:HSF-type DNA-binding-domain-containing protein n=1 Tax=Phascolomyces articulosus TaxID=60185 RepID=A0AAD5K5F9_9FUNG|nr:HSF-type DNA-binding-domain-containing protein [Phascolomyces articulosus]